MAFDKIKDRFSQQGRLNRLEQEKIELQKKQELSNKRAANVKLKQEIAKTNRESFNQSKVGQGLNSLKENFAKKAQGDKKAPSFGDTKSPSVKDNKSKKKDLDINSQNDFIKNFRL